MVKTAYKGAQLKTATILLEPQPHLSIAHHDQIDRQTHLQARLTVHGRVHSLRQPRRGGQYPYLIAPS